MNPTSGNLRYRASELGLRWGNLYSKPAWQKKRSDCLAPNVLSARRSDLNQDVNNEPEAALVIGEKNFGST